MNTSKIIKGVVGGGRYTVTAPIVKEDYGLYLQIEGIELPSTYEVDFSNSENSGSSVTMIGNADGVLIPRQFIDSGKDVFAFLYHVGEDFGRTVYKFRIPNKVRPDRTNEEPTPEEQSTIDQCINALNTAVEQTAQDVTSAQGYANLAQEHARTASQSALDSQISAEASAQSAQTAQDALEEFTTPTASATTLPERSNATASYADGHFSFGIPTGATGAKGDKGDTGAQGERGEKGIQGPQGEQGVQGIQGPKGDKGDKGDTGATGPKGDKGDTGETGAQGPTGPQGIQGEQGPKGDKGDKGDTGSQGERGTGVLKVTTAPTSYTTTIGGFSPKFRIALSTVQSQAHVDEVLVGDVISHSYNLYNVGYVDDAYAYLSAATSIRGAKGAAGATGPAGSDANVTSENIESALGYVPVSLSFVDSKIDALITKHSSAGYVLTYDSTISESKPYPWSWAPAPVGATLFQISSNDSAGIYYVVSQLKAAADNSGVASMSVPFEAGQAFLSNIYGVYQNNKTPIVVVQGASPNPIMRYLAINNLWAESLETGISGAEMGYWDGLYHIEIVIGTSTLTIIVEKKG